MGKRKFSPLNIILASFGAAQWQPCLFIAVVVVTLTRKTRTNPTWQDSNTTPHHHSSAFEKSHISLEARRRLPLSRCCFRSTLSILRPFSFWMRVRYHCLLPALHCISSGRSFLRLFRAIYPTQAFPFPHSFARSPPTACTSHPRGSLFTLVQPG